MGSSNSRFRSKRAGQRARRRLICTKKPEKVGIVVRGEICLFSRKFVFLSIIPCLNEKVCFIVHRMQRRAECGGRIRGSESVCYPAYGWEVQPFTGEKYKNAPSCSVFPVRLFKKRNFLLQFAENGYII